MSQCGLTVHNHRWEQIRFSMHFCNGNTKFVYSTALQYAMRFLSETALQVRLACWYLVEELDRVVSSWACPLLGGDSPDVPVFFWDCSASGRLLGIPCSQNAHKFRCISTHILLIEQTNLAATCCHKCVNTAAKKHNSLDALKYLTHTQPLGRLCPVTPLDLHPPLQTADYNCKRQTLWGNNKKTIYWPPLRVGLYIFILYCECL